MPEPYRHSMTSIQPQSPFTPTLASGPVHRVETVVVGGGQAGLATAHWLAEAGRECLVLEERERIGDQWRERYDSLRLFTPARVDGLPGLDFPGRASAFPSGRELADYLEQYGDSLGESVRTGVRVLSVDRVDGSFLLTTTAGAVSAENVVVAIGSDAVPNVPEVSAALDPGIRQLHSSQYRNPAQLLPGPVLVVGAGTSGADLAMEAVGAGHETWLSGHHPGEIPGNERVRAPLFWFAANHVLTLRNPLGRRARAAMRAAGRAPLVRTRRADLDAAGVHRTQARTVGAVDGKPRLDDGAVLDVANVLWCTGYRRDYSFVPAVRLDDDGFPLEHDGAAEGVPGLYFVGLFFQSAFSSHLVGGVGRDAKAVADQITARVPAVR
jgi:putative flavoprotein involved in K+ transport